MFEELESQFDMRLPENTYAAIRVDGKNFSKLTKPLRKDYPFSDAFSERMLNAARYLAQEVSGAVCVYTQSDEISVIFQDLEEKSQKWFGGRIQKILSTSAAYASVAFNEDTDDMATFDSRVFDLGNDPELVINYLDSRLKSGTRNSVSMLTSHYYSHKQMMNKSVKECRQMILDAGDNWAELPEVYKYGTFFYKEDVERTVEYEMRGERYTTQVTRPAWKTTTSITNREVFRKAL